MNSSTSFDSMFPDREAFRPVPRKRSPKRRVKRSRASDLDFSIDDSPLPGVGTMARTKRLILAALRVWELKRGIRD